MKYLLDTNVFVAILRGKKPLVAARYLSHAPADLFACSVVIGELCVGAARSRNPAAEQAKVDALTANHISLPFDDAAARRFGAERAALEILGLVVPDLDIMIASVALLHGLTLVTHNTADFIRFSQLQLADWELP